MENNLSGSLGLNPEEEKTQVFNIFEELKSEELPVGMIMFESFSSITFRKKNVLIDKPMHL